MRKKDSPAIAHPLMEVYRALRGFRGKVRRFGIDSQRHLVFPPSAGQLLRINMASNPGFSGFVKKIRQDAGNVAIARAVLAVGLETCAGAGIA
jgi:hypothetical protein